MIKYQDFATDIRQSVTIRMSLRMYVGGEIPSYNRISCPIHHGENKNFAFTNEFFRCFTCGAHGDVIELVMQLYSISFFDAIKKLNDDFNLGLPIGRKPTLKESLELKRKKAEATHDMILRAWQKMSYELRYDELWNEWARQKRLIESLKPSREDDDWDERFCQALIDIKKIEYKIDNEL